LRPGLAGSLYQVIAAYTLRLNSRATLVPSLELHTGPACEAAFSAGMQREHVPPQRRKKKERKDCTVVQFAPIVFGCQARTFIIMAKAKKFIIK